jgi:hypothetical protein
MNQQQLDLFDEILRPEDESLKRLQERLRHRLWARSTTWCTSTTLQAGG